MRSFPLSILLLCAACVEPSPLPVDAGATRDAGAPGTDAGFDAGIVPVRAPFGLDERPSNTTCLAPEFLTESAAIALERVFPALKFDAPLAMLQAPGDATRWFVVQQGGTVMVFPDDPAATAATPFVTIPVRTGGEMGLLGMAFHPQWATNHQAFLSFTRQNGVNLESHVARYTSSDGGATLDPASEEFILTVYQPYQNHNGGGIAFGPDGLLYIGYGDGGSGGDPFGNGQKLDALLGKFLRIDVDHPAEGKKYGIPPSNPFAAGGGAPEIFAWGLRNPWRWSFDRDTGELWAGDVGQNLYEEIDRVVVGGNYGWVIKEGTHCYARETCPGPFVEPVVEYGHLTVDPLGGNSVVGGYVYRGKAIKTLAGRYVFGDTTTGRIWTLTHDPATGAGGREMLANNTGVYISTFAEDPAGELYVLDLLGGRILKLVANGAGPPSRVAQQLSKTGCVSPTDAKHPANALIPYTVNAPLWSDGARKDRWFSIPDGSQIHVEADGDWTFPEGSVLMKTFWLGERRVETRLFMHHRGGVWAGYSYEWNDTQTDATLLPAGKVKTIGAQAWTYPGRAECLACHTQAAGRSLGLETAQLDGETLYASTARISPQLATLEHVGLFDALPAATAPLPAYDTGAPVSARARAYLHSNCSNCHRPGGPGRGNLDWRFTTTLADTHACDAVPVEGDLGIADAKVISPGKPDASIVLARMRAHDVHRMPPLGSVLTDEAGVAFVRDWIAGLASCEP